MLENTEGVIKKDNPEKLATLGTQDTGQIHCLVYPMLPVSLDCPFVLPLRYSLTFICRVSCVPNVASFSGLSIVDHTFCIRYRLMKTDCTYWVPVNRVSDTYLPYLFRLLLFHISITCTTVTITMTNTMTLSLIPKLSLFR
jgi:hypothetical protein